MRGDKLERDRPLVDVLLTAGFALIVSFLAMYHEMWRDEVRAFSVATGAGSWGELIRELHHEGHPAVWYIILRAGFALTHSNLVLPVAAIVIGIITAWLILRHAPFPMWLRILAVFGAFLTYELTVVARNYGIGVLFMVCACIAFQHRRSRPFYLALALALMANTSVHAALGALVIIAVWLYDLLDRESRPALLSPIGMSAVVLAILGVAVAFWTAHPSPDMAWVVSGSTLDGSKILMTILTDPGLALHGVYEADIAAAGELPWRVMGISGGVASRIIVDAALAWLLWSFRKDWRSLSAIVVTILGFEIVFRNVYSGALRHEGVVLFLLFSIGWIAILRARERGDAADTMRRVARGLMPLFAMQTIALPVMAHRFIKYRESNSKAYGEMIRANPRYANAILMSEPDYLTESMPYYVPNRTYMARQREFQRRVYFDRGTRRTLDLSLARLSQIADSVACEYKVPVLLAIGDRNFHWWPIGYDTIQYKGSVFHWTEPEWRAFRASAPMVGKFPYSTKDEIWRAYEVNCPAVVRNRR